ncbi:hypothetical protein [Streptomyces sp. NPDC051921]|uniref:hypothetical protein n=1 Tax=Streptomyces sp. NPDC051921 TaxID=3155806 RepID=UPI00342E64CB
MSVVIATATGAATGLGEGMGAVVAEAVRSRLRTTDRGRVALERLDDDPAAPGVREEAQDVLREEIEADPEWRDRLQVQLTSRSTQTTTQTTGSVVINGGRVSRSQITLGPLTVNNTSGGRAVLAVALVLVLALVSLGTYGVVQIVTSDDSSRNAASPGASHDSASTGPLEGPAPTESATSDAATETTTSPTEPRFNTQAEAIEVLPREGEVPSWLEYRLSPEMTPEQFCDVGRVTYTKSGSYDDIASFRADACGSTADAESHYQESVSKLQVDPYSLGPLKETPMAALGDARVHFVREITVSRSKVSYMIVRAGRFVLTFQYGPIGDGAAFPKEIDSMIRTFVKKAQAEPIG